MKSKIWIYSKLEFCTTIVSNPRVYKTLSRSDPLGLVGLESRAHYKSKNSYFNFEPI